MVNDARQELKADFEEFTQTRFPKLGYRVEGFPETDSVLAGLVSQGLAGKHPIAVNEPSIVSQELLAGVAEACQQYPGSQEAAELKAYVEKMKKLEADLRRLESLPSKE